MPVVLEVPKPTKSSLCPRRPLKRCSLWGPLLHRLGCRLAWVKPQPFGWCPCAHPRQLQPRAWPAAGPQSILAEEGCVALPLRGRVFPAESRCHSLLSCPRPPPTASLTQGQGTLCLPGPKLGLRGVGRWGLLESSPFTDFACVPFLRVEQSSRLYNFSDCSDILPDKESEARGHPAPTRIPSLVFHPLPPSILAGLSRKPMLAHGGSLRYTVP